MWQSTCCLLVALVLAIIGVSVDILMADIGTALQGNVWIDLYYGWNDMSWTITTANDETSNSATYEHSYSRYCNFTFTEEREFCRDLKKVRDAGKVYIVLNVIGIFILSVAVVISIFALLGRYLCSCACRTKYVVSILCAGAIVCLGIAFSYFLGEFSQDTNQLISRMTPFHVVDWSLAEIGPSIGLLIASVSIGFITLIFILWVDKGWDKNSNYQRLQDPPAQTCCLFYKPDPSPVVIIQPKFRASEGEPMTIPVPSYYQGGGTTSASAE